MIRRYRRLRTVLLASLAVLTVAGPALAGPFASNGGLAVTPTQYVITFKTIEFRRSDGSYFTFFSGSQTLDIGSAVAAAGGVGGSVGSGQSLPAGRYDAIRVTFSRDFSITATSGASTVGPAGGGFFCGTGGSTNATISDGGGGNWTVQVVTRSGSQVTPTSRTLSIPPEANTTIDGQSGMAVVGNDIQVTNVITAFTVLATDTVPPAFTVQFDVSNGVEFLNDGTCYAIFLPPTVTYITPSGTTTYAGGL